LATRGERDAWAAGVEPVTPNVVAKLALTILGLDGENAQRTEPAGVTEAGPGADVAVALADAAAAVEKGLGGQPATAILGPGTAER